MDKQLNHVFCVDDEADILEVASLCLETVGGFQVTRCSSGVEALPMLDRLRPDIILLDVMMPDMDGPTTLLALRQKPHLANIPVVFMTARAAGGSGSVYEDRRQRRN